MKRGRGAREVHFKLPAVLMLGTFVLLREGPKTVDELQEALGISRRGVKRYLEVLRVLGVLETDGGRTSRGYFEHRGWSYWLTPGAMDEIARIFD